MDEIIVNGVTYVKKEKMADKIYMVRSTAGVFYGEIIEEDGNTVTMRNARRVWYWAGAASLSQLSQEGTKDAENCKFPCIEPFKKIYAVSELILMTDKSVKSLNEVAIWKK